MFRIWKSEISKQRAGKTGSWKFSVVETYLANFGNSQEKSRISVEDLRGKKQQNEGEGGYPCLPSCHMSFLHLAGCCTGGVLQ